ncbi:MAG: 2-dehydropantoate 2-reductase [Gammaproteobacteria bacterium]|nr:2-dehydropantoate 2-reductase [Gammaproteobacteria bacterium]
MTANTILIAGAGAIGCYYGSLLANAGQSVSLLVRSGYDHIKQHGVEIDSIHGEWNFKPAHVIQHAAELPLTADYVLVTTKVTEQVDRAGLIRDAISPDTTIVLIQNGIDIEQEVAHAFPDNHLISGLAFICATRCQPGFVKHTAYGRLVIGDYPNGIREKTRRFAELFKNSGIDCNITDDVVTARWQKTVWNAPFNPVSVLSDGLDTQSVLQTREDYLRAIMTEVTEIAAALNHPLRDDIVDINIESTRSMPPYKTSMLLDYERGQCMETEAILGNAVRAAHGAGIEAPYLTSLYSLMKLKETRIAQSS